MKKNKKAARQVQKEQRAMQTELDEFKNQTYNNLQDVIKAITDDIEYKDAFMRGPTTSCDQLNSRFVFHNTLLLLCTAWTLCFWFHHAHFWYKFFSITLDIQVL